MLIAFHKPYGVLSQWNENPDQLGQMTLAGFSLPRNCLPLGRLDMDSEGLLLLSDEPELERHLLHPSREHRRVYQVQVEGSVSEASLDKVRAGGLAIRGYETLPCIARMLEQAPEIAPRVPAIEVHPRLGSTWLELELREGKNRQVRRMTAKLGHPTQRLVRVQIGDYALGDLAAGAWRELDEQQRELVFM